MDAKDAKDLEVGDKVIVQLTKEDIEYLQSAGVTSLKPEGIISVHERPVNWANVKPGMAFRSTYGQTIGIVWYVGPCVQKASEVIVATKKDSWSNPILWMNPKVNLTRLPSEDVNIPF